MLGTISGIVIIGAVLTFDVWCIGRLLIAPIDLMLFLLALAVTLSLLFLVLMAYWMYGLLSLGYLLDRNGLVIRWGPREYVVPMGNIQRIVRAEDVPSAKWFWGIVWPGYRAGRGYIKGLGSVRTYATRPLRKQLLVLTPSQVYGISPATPQAFLDDYERRRGLGVVRRLEQAEHRARWLAWSMLGDRKAQALVVIGLLANASLFAYVSVVYQNLPQILPLHFDTLGEVDRVGVRSGLFTLPLIGLIVAAFDTLIGITLHSKQATGAYLLFAANLLVQILLWAAVVNIVL